MTTTCLDTGVGETLPPTAPGRLRVEHLREAKSGCPASLPPSSDPEGTTFLPVRAAGPTKTLTL